MTNQTPNQPQNTNPQAAANQTFEKLSPVIELTLILLVKMREYLEIYARDINAANLQQYNDAKVALEDAINKIAPIFGLKLDDLLMSKQLQKLAGQLQQMQQKPAPAPTAPQAPAAGPQPTAAPAPQPTTMPTTQAQADQIAAQANQPAQTQPQQVPATLEKPETANSGSAQGTQESQDKPDLTALLEELEQQVPGASDQNK